MYGPVKDHFLRSGEWKTNPPFRVPTSTTVLPFLTLTKATTCDAGEDVDLVSGREPHAVGSPSDEFVVHEDVHVLAEAARLVEDAVPDAWEGHIEARDEGREVRRLEEHLALSSREGEERGRDSHEDARADQFLRGDARIQSIPRVHIE